MNLALGQTIGGRYNIIRQLGQGGFGATFVAHDQHLPSDRNCVVKQLKPQATDPFTLQTARRLFETEAKILHQLGHHNQIPQLFAYFEESQEFYLVQELIEGDDLSQELTPGTSLSQVQVIELLQEILTILAYVHQHHVIHRDINPHNLIRRKSDGKLVLIDFGAVKQVSTQIVQGQSSIFTVAIGTPGYRPSEQANGNPRLSSDIYAVGIVGIQALTGAVPQELPIDPDSGEICWRDRTSVSPELAKVLDQMIRYDFRERYPSAEAALQALEDLTQPTRATVALGTNSPSSPPVNQSSKGKKPIVVVLLIALAVIAGGGGATVAMINWINSTNATQSYNRGETLLELRRYEDALSAYNRAVELQPDYGEAWLGQGEALLALGKPEAALDAYDKAIQIQREYPEAWKGRGEALVALQRYEEAISAFDQVTKLQPEDVETWERRGIVQMKLQRYSAAIASYDKALEIQPNYASAWYRRGWAFHNLQQYEEAIKSYDKAVEHKPDSAEFWYQRGNAFVNLNKYREAVDSYQKAVQFQPDFYRAWYSQGSILNNLNQYQEALAAFDQAVKLQSNNYEALYGRAWALHKLERYQEALTAYERVIKVKPNSDQAWYNRGNVFYTLQQYQDAIAAYNQAVAHKRSHYQAWNSRANALVNLKRYSEALTSYENALTYKPDYKEAKQGKDQTQRQLEELKNQSYQESSDEDDKKR
ncbi:MAG: tetratricopeptide repeat protein [Coleofasciculus sp. G1-WW12-02]|uniref:tetratricopeptide repeat protein n=1 Tax=Coleofasciculus sp. G1-WW12-02 TaxID=3068483 RepID=UPI003302EA58